ncbi:MAG TPA: hypothetical protein VNB23_10510, partial [Ramlibacter sp.]|nr:hypothetical protein [Ramlibacter sp.]
RFTFNSFREYVKQRPTIGKDFVQDAARQKGKEIFPVPGNSGVAFLDVNESRVAGGERIRSTHGMMGLNSGFVTFTITTTEALADSEYVKQLLAVGIKDLLGRIRDREI